VRWFVPLNATYVHCRVASILYKFDFMMDWWGIMDNMGKQVVSLRICHNSCKLG
jgi:hypothetical protein